MRWLLLIGLGATFSVGCEKTVYRSHESHYCSSTKDDEPYYECSKGSDLVCATTYQMTFGSKEGAPPKTIDIWLCRLSCFPDKKGDCQSGEVCCPAPIYGTTYGKSHVCVAPEYCPALAVPTPPRDGGARDTASDLRPDGGSDTASEAGSDGGGDGGSDVPQTLDADGDLPPG